MIRFRVLLLLLGDLLVLFGTYLLTAALFTEVGFFPELNLELFVSEDAGLAKIGGVVATLMIGMYFLGLYEQIRVSSRLLLLQDLIMVFGVAFLAQGLLSYIFRGLVMSRTIMIVGSGLALVFMLLWRWAYSVLLVRVVGQQRVLFLGDSLLARRVAEYMEANLELGYRVVGCVDSTTEGTFPGGEWIYPGEDLEARIEQIKPDRLTVSGAVSAATPLGRQLLRFSMRGMRVEPLGELYERLFYRVAIETVTPEELILSEAYKPAGWVMMSQEIYGRLIALIGLILSFPLMLLVAIAVKLDSEGPAILRQTRLSQGGVPFPLLKFRSMYVDADKRFGPVRAKENDRRITRVGKWIRLTRIDELPQFWNVMCGHMSVVGPRPEMPELEAKLVKDIPLYPQRHRVKPGITGWAQIHHEPEDSTGATVRKLEYDLYYIKHITPLFDWVIMFHTAKAVIFRMGAR